MGKTKVFFNKLASLWQRPWFYLILAALILLWRILEFNLPDILLDDAFISFRYAQNLANGLGMVFNSGERVEGYTNFLWVVILASFRLMGLNMITASKVLAVFATFGTLILIYFLSRQLFRGYAFEFVFVALPLLVFSSQSSQARYAVSGMETSLFTFLITLSVFLLLNRRLSWLAGMSFALAAMTRPEGVLYFAIAILGAGILSLLSLFKNMIDKKALAISFLSFVIFYGTYFLWRYDYFGFLLPNTYYVKAAGFQLARLTRGWATLLDVLLQWHVYLLIGLAFFALFSFKRDWAWVLFSAYVITTLAYFIFVGGDFTVWFGPRFIMPILPILLLMSSEGLHNLLSQFFPFPPPLARLVAFIALLIIVGISYFYSWTGGSRGLEKYFAPQMRAWAELGRWIEANTSPGISIATDAAGLIPYYSQRYTYDMFGLTDLHIAHLQMETVGAGIVAHEKFDPQYILAQKPDCIISTWMDADGNAVSAGLMSVREQFKQNYHLVAVAKSRNGPPENGRWVIETEVYKPNLYDRGYISGLFCRR